MLTLARIYLPDDGTAPAPPDSSTAGWLQVVYKGEVRWARPCFPPGLYAPPNDLWLRKYAEKYAAWVTSERTELQEEDEDHLIYMGFLPLEEIQPDDIEAGFPNKTLAFSGRWEAVTSDDPADPYIELRYTADPDEANAPDAPGATTFKLSQKPGEETITLTQFVDGEASGTAFTMQADGSVAITVKGGASYTLEQTKATTLIDGGAGLKVEGKDASATLTLGSGAVHGVIYEELLSFMTSLKSWLATHTHTAPPSGGPTTPPIEAGGIPDLPTSTKASKLKIPS